MSALDRKQSIGIYHEINMLMILDSSALGR